MNLNTKVRLLQTFNHIATIPAVALMNVVLRAGLEIIANEVPNPGIL